MANKYELMAARITEVFAAHRIPARCWRCNVSPQVVSFKFTFALNVKLNKVEALGKEIATNLAVASVRFAQRGDGATYIEIPREGGSRLVDLVEIIGRLPSVPPQTGAIGIDSSNAPLLLRMDSPNVAHLLIAGTTGSGKTEALTTLLLSLALLNRPGQLQIALIDPKRKLAALASLPHIWRGLGLVSELDDAALLLAALVGEMERRDRVGRSMPHIIIGIDELADLIQAGGEAIADPLQRLTQRGREAGLHVVAATQKPAATLVGSLVKANFPVRLVGSVVSAEDAKVAAGIPGTGAERLAGTGDFLCVVKGQVIRFQVAYVPKEQRPALVAAASAAQRRHRSWTEAEINRAVREYNEATPVNGGARQQGSDRRANESDEARRSREQRELLAKLADLLPAEQGADAWRAAQEDGGAASGVGKGEWEGMGARVDGETSPVSNFGASALLPPTHSPTPIPTSPPYATAGGALAARSTVVLPSRKSRPAPRGEGSRLRNRYTPAQMYDAYLAAGWHKTNACIALFKYSDPVTLRLMNEAIALVEQAAPRPVLPDAPAVDDLKESVA